MRLKGDGTSGATRGLPFGAGVVTKDNWPERATAFMRSSGRRDGEHPVVRSDAALGTQAQFWCWIMFLRRLGLRTGFAQFQGFMTVPADWPWEFSADADALRGREAEIVRHWGKPDARIDAKRRAAMAEELRQAAVPEPELEPA